MPAVLNDVTLVAALPAPTASVVVGPPLVDLLFDQPAATDANLVFGANYIAPRDDVVVLASLPLPVVAIKFIPPARAELLAELPAVTMSIKSMARGFWEGRPSEFRSKPRIPLTVNLLTCGAGRRQHGLHPMDDDWRGKR